MPEEIKKNIFLFFGEDDFSLRQKLQVWKDEFAKKFTIQGIVVLQSDNLPELEMQKKLEEAVAPSLFSSKKLIIAKNFLPSKANQANLIATIEKLLNNLPADYFLIFWQSSIDRRLSFIKQLTKEVTVVEFGLPHGRELDAWIYKQAKALGLDLDTETLEKIAVMAGRDLFEEKKIAGRVIDRREFFDLWQIYSDLQKIAAFSNKPITREIGELMVPKVSDNVFALSDAVVAQNKKAALAVLEKLMNDDSADEKSMSIKLLGLLSEQIRSQLVVNLLKQQNMDQNQIASFLGWSPGRVFITLKNSASFSVDKLKKILAKLLAADTLIKTSDTNPKLLIDLLIAS